METLSSVKNRILKTRDIEEAGKMILRYSHSKNNFKLSDIIESPEVCNHLGWLLFKLEPPIPTGSRQEDMRREAEWQAKYYEIGKDLYIMMVDVHGRGSLIITPFLAAWYSKFLGSRISCRNQEDPSYLSDGEMRELARITDSSTRAAIDQCYCDRIRKVWVNKPKENPIK
ncbi:MAG: hypothetical protein WC719_01755 [Patescibacteria group bacterium]|jgi:hypothetical protein